jgi:hypothetical protein
LRYLFERVVRASSEVMTPHRRHLLVAIVVAAILLLVAVAARSA